MNKDSKNTPMNELMAHFPRKGKVEWIGLRPAKRATLNEVNAVVANSQNGLEGDHFAGQYSQKRQVTLIQAEHLVTVASLMGVAQVDPGLVRRNIVVKGINLLALKEKQFKIGEAILETTGLCHPCSRMETNLGEGGYNAMRGHGGITAKVVKGGEIKQGDAVEALEGFVSPE
ncbi:MAG TPA: MOSC domain-containing protein [Microscillaceae bacterium]|nr:MOSC domain-containing protein [Microscillaceae bacterium]